MKKFENHCFKNQHLSINLDIFEFSFLLSSTCSNFLSDFFFVLRLFRSMQFNFQISRSFPEIFLFLISNLMPLWSKHSLVSILLNLLRHILWPTIWSILVNVPCVLVSYILQFLCVLFYTFLVVLADSLAALYHKPILCSDAYFF